jgi:hypothetical protein
VFHDTPVGFLRKRQESVYTFSKHSPPPFISLVFYLRSLFKTITLGNIFQNTSNNETWLPFILEAMLKKTDLFK